MLQAAIIVLAGWYVFSPALHGDWLWDDHEIRDNPTLHEGWPGLGKIWVAPTTTDYYPVEATFLWVAWHLWGDSVAGYHLANLGLHLAGAFLLWRVLARLGVRPAFLAALLFVVHPLAVESVAWISEIKNTLSLPFLLLATLAWIEWDEVAQAGTRLRPAELGAPPRQAPALLWYVASLLGFLVAMLSKSSAVMFPAVLLLYAWWRRGRVGGADLRATAPFFLVSLILGLVAIHFQSDRAIGDWRTPVAGLLPRAGGAGLALVFYFWKCVCPLEVMPIYPGWSAGMALLDGWFAWLTIAGVLLGLVRQARLGPSPLGAAARNSLLGFGWFALFLLPVLGFIPMAYQHIAPVGDQLVYISLAGIVGLAAGAVGAVLKVAQAGTRLRPAERGTPPRQAPALLRIVGCTAVAAIVLSLAIKSHAYAGVFVNQETLWTYNAEHNSRSSSVYSNLGFVLNRSGHPGPAAVSYEKAVELDPDDAEAQDEFADLLAGQNKIAEARPHYEKAIAVYTAALQRDSSLRGVNNRLGLDLTKVGRAAEAVVQFEQALARNPVSYEVHTNLGLALFHLGRIPEAISHYAAAARLNPGSATIQSNLGYALVVAGRPAEALVHFEQALQIDPDYPGAHNNAGYALAQLGRYAEARSQFEAALRLTPDDAEARSNLARLPPPPP